MILDKLNEVLLKVDNISNSVTSQTAQPQPQHNPVAEAVANAQRPRTHIQTGVPDTVAQRCSPESLEVQAPFASTDCLLTWPIFGGQWPDSLLSREILSGSFHFAESGNEWEARPARHQGPGIREEHVPQLVERFLQFVHPKNPILYIEQIREHARRIAEDGFGWDATSCIVVSRHSGIATYNNGSGLPSYALLTRTALGLRSWGHSSPVRSSRRGRSTPWPKLDRGILKPSPDSRSLFSSSSQENRAARPWYCDKSVSHVHRYLLLLYLATTARLVSNSSSRIDVIIIFEGARRLTVAGR